MREFQPGDRVRVVGHRRLSPLEMLPIGSEHVVEANGWVQGWETSETAYHRFELIEDVPPQQTPAPSPAATLLREAANIVEGARNTTHGDKERSFELIGRLWSDYLDGRTPSTEPGSTVTAVDVANMMVLLKIARSIQGEPVRDHFVDMAGYAAVAGELAGAA